MLANYCLILAGGQAPPGAELHACTLNSAWEFALICQMDPALQPPIQHFLPLFPHSGEIPSVSEIWALQELHFTSKGILLN